jgi:hypothetical protein
VGVGPIALNYVDGRPSPDVFVDEVQDADYSRSIQQRRPLFYFRALIRSR